MAKIYGSPAKCLVARKLTFPLTEQNVWIEKIRQFITSSSLVVLSGITHETQFLYSFNIVEGARKLNARSIEPGAVLFFFFLSRRKKNDKGPAVDISYLQYQYFYDSFR